jgi:hypothetical protein
VNKVYVSHCKKDEVVATELMALAEPHDYKAVSLGYHPEDGVPPDRDFERDVCRLLTDAVAVVVLCSPESMASRWVTSEIAYARAAGKALFAVRLRPCALDSTLQDHDVVDLSGDNRNAWPQLWVALRFSALGAPDLFDWDPARSPFPGAAGFKEEDAAVFRGRDEAVRDALARLYRMQRTSSARMMAIVGPAGAGKASLLRAGLMPRLLRDSMRWIVLEPLSTKADPFAALGASIAAVFRRYGEPLDGRMLTADLRNATMGKDPNTAARAVRHLAQQLSDKLRRVAGRMDATPLLLLPHMDRLLVREDHSESSFLGLLRTLLSGSDRPLAAIGTINSPSLHAFQSHHAIAGLPCELVTLQPLTPAQLKLAITGPANNAKLTLEAGFIETLLDVVNQIEDPRTRQVSLAAALRKLWKDHGGQAYFAREHLDAMMPVLERAAAKVPVVPTPTKTPRPPVASVPAAPATEPTEADKPTVGPAAEPTPVDATTQAAAQAAAEFKVPAATTTQRFASSPDVPQAPSAKSAPQETVDPRSFDGPTPLDRPAFEPPSRVEDLRSSRPELPVAAEAAPFTPPLRSNELPPATEFAEAPAPAGEEPSETVAQTVEPAAGKQGAGVMAPPAAKPTSRESGLSQAAQHVATVPAGGNNRRSIGMALLLVGVSAGVAWHLGHQAHRRITHAHEAVSHSHDEIEPAHTRRAAHKRRLAAAVTQRQREAGTEASSNNIASQSATGVRQAAATTGATEPPQPTAPNAAAGTENLRTPAAPGDEKAMPAGSQAAEQATAAGPATERLARSGDDAVVAKVLQADAPLTGLLALAALTAKRHPTNGLRAALQVDSQQLPVSEFAALTGGVKHIAFSGDGERLAAGNRDHVVVVAAADCRVLGRWRNGGFVDARLNGDGTGLLTLHDDGKARWRPVAGGAATVLGAVRPPQPGRIWSHVAFSADGLSVWVVARHSLARLWLNATKPPQEEDVGGAKIRHLLTTPAGLRMVTTAKNILKVWKWQQDKPVARFIDRIQYSQGGRVFIAARMSADGKLLVTADAGPVRSGKPDKRVGMTIWHRKKNGYWWNLRAKFISQPGGTTMRATVGISADGSRAIANLERPPPAPGEHAGHQTWFFERRDWRRPRRGEHLLAVSPAAAGLLHRAIDGQAQQIAFDASSRFLGGAAVSAFRFWSEKGRLATGHSDGAVRLWGRVKPTTTRLGWQPPKAISGDPEGSTIATTQAAPGGGVRLVDGAAAGSTLAAPPAGMQSVVVHATGKRAMHASNKRLHVWRLGGDAAPMVAPLPQCKNKPSLAFTRDGRHVVATCGAVSRALLVDWPLILAALRSKTRACLPADQRRRLLGEAPDVARARAAACAKKEPTKRP